MRAPSRPWICSKRIVISTCCKVPAAIGWLGTAPGRLGNEFRLGLCSWYTGTRQSAHRRAERAARTLVTTFSANSPTRPCSSSSCHALNELAMPNAPRRSRRRGRPCNRALHVHVHVVQRPHLSTVIVEVVLATVNCSAAADQSSAPSSSPPYSSRPGSCSRSAPPHGPTPRTHHDRHGEPTASDLRRSSSTSSSR